MLTLLIVVLVFILAIMAIFAILGAIAVSPVILLVGALIGADYLILKKIIGKKKDK